MAIRSASLSHSPNRLQIPYENGQQCPIQEFKSYVPCRVNESHHVLVESSIDGVYDGEFSEGLHHGEQHGSDDNEAKDLFKKTVIACQSWKGLEKCIPSFLDHRCAARHRSRQIDQHRYCHLCVTSKSKLHLSAQRVRIPMAIICIWRPRRLRANGFAWTRSSARWTPGCSP